MKKFYHLLSLLVLMHISSQAQESKPKKDQPMSLQLLAGSQGFGANFRYVVSPFIGLRAGGSYIKGGINDKVNFDGFSTKNRLSGELATVQGLVELNPSGFVRLVAGAAYFGKANAELYFEPKQSQTVGEVTLNPDEIGNLTYHINWGKAAPYLGLGLGRGIPKNKFNVNLDLGTYFLQSPIVTATGTKLLTDNEQSAAQIQENMKDYKFMPVIQLNFNFRF